MSHSMKPIIIRTAVRTQNLTTDSYLTAMWWDTALTLNDHCVRYCLMVVVLQQHGGVIGIGPLTVSAFIALRIKCFCILHNSHNFSYT